jgi:hypothetical protein
MRVMVSLNLADIMTSTRPRTSQRLREALENEADPGASREEPKFLGDPDHSEPFDREPATIPTQV